MASGCHLGFFERAGVSGSDTVKKLRCRHLVEFRQGRIDVVPSVTAHAVRHELRSVTAGVVKARGVDGEPIGPGRKCHIDR